jgi:holo-[acyl-carrier protein] synthase
MEEPRQVGRYQAAAGDGGYDRRPPQYESRILGTNSSRCPERYGKQIAEQTWVVSVNLATPISCRGCYHSWVSRATSRDCAASRPSRAGSIILHELTEGLTGHGIPHAGIDAAEIPRIARALERWGQRFRDRVYTPAEQRYCRDKARRFAGRFAAKEAISKVLGTGIRYIRWREIEILPDPRGKPVVYLHGRAAETARRLGLGPISVSITHTDDLALAFALGLGTIAPDQALAGRRSAGEVAPAEEGEGDQQCGAG